MSYIFISYSHKDSAYTRKLADSLEERGFEVWIDERIDYGTRWPHVIQEQVDACSAFIVVMTPNSYESEWAQNELVRAKRKRKPIFPLLLEGSEPWLSVEATQYCDVRAGKLPPADFYARLATVVPVQTLVSEVASEGVYLDETPGEIWAEAIEIFFSYAHEDESLRDELEKHLSILKRQGVISGWHDRRIGAGREWEGEIDAHLNTAQVILLLVSADFLASDYCWDVEVKRAMERHEAGEARVIPIILRPVDWKDAPFGKLQALPTDAKPVITWENRDEAFLDVVQGIQAVVKELASDESPSVAQRRIDTSKYYHIVSKVSNDKCLDVFGSQIADGTKIQLYRLHRGDNQQWRFMPAGNEYWHIVSKLSLMSSKCLDVHGSQTADGTPVELYSLHRNDNQQWELIPSERGYFHIVSKLSKLSPHCLALTHGETTDETPIQLCSLHRGDSQQWELVVASERHPTEQRKTPEAVEVLPTPTPTPLCEIAGPEFEGYTAKWKVTNNDSGSATIQQIYINWENSDNGKLVRIEFTPASPLEAMVIWSDLSGVSPPQTISSGWNPDGNRTIGGGGAEKTLEFKFTKWKSGSTNPDNYSLNVTFDNGCEASFNYP